MATKHCEIIILSAVRSLVFNIHNVMAETEHEGEDSEQVVEKVKKFLRDGCGCTLGPKNGPCSLQFTEGTMLFNLNNCLLSSAELDLVILTSIQAFTRAAFIGCKRSPCCSFYFQSKPICNLII